MAEQEWQEWAIARKRVDTVLGPDDGTTPDTEVPLIRGMLFAVEVLATPPHRREAALKGGFYGGSWRPGS